MRAGPAGWTAVYYIGPYIIYIIYYIYYIRGHLKTPDQQVGRPQVAVRHAVAVEVRQALRRVRRVPVRCVCVCVCVCECE